MQANEPIRVQPMASRGGLPVNHGYLNIRPGHQRVDEGKTGRTRSHDQVIGIDKHAPVPVVRATIVPRLQGVHTARPRDPRRVTGRMKKERPAALGPPTQGVPGLQPCAEPAIRPLTPGKDDRAA